MHVGTARTALFNYLFARRNRGTFVLRIEDTDVERNVAGGADAIVEALRWLGLAWDEGYAVGGDHGPYVQTERLERYQAAVAGLVDQGAAYRCWCTAEEVDQRTAARRAQGQPPGYDGHCRTLTSEQVRAYEAEGRTPAVRFRMPDEGETVVDDLVRGRVTFANATESDFVILRSSGIPTYQFAVVYDDLDMRISHVIRGEDLLSSTPRQTQVHLALGNPSPPRFGHLPLLVGDDRKKLSKRHGDLALEAYRANGYLPEAMVNYLALLGWSLDDHTEFFTLAELERAFAIERVTHNPAAFDVKKLDALNGQHLRQFSPDAFARRALGFVRDAGHPNADEATLRQAAPLVAERVTRLDEVPGMVGFLFGEITMDPDAAAKLLTEPARKYLADVADALARLGPWTADAVEATLRGLQADHGLGAKKAFQPVRLAVTGRLVSPPLFESVALLGRDASVARIRAAAETPAPGPA
jgi:glutamyl-tRNA synthetase